jgi:NTP pyrophosphatase (non-canonical NTP hydrolase)
MDKLTFSRLREANKQRRAEIHPISKKYSELEWTACLCGEAGELANYVKKRSRINYEGDLHKSDIKKEIADVLIYLDLIANEYDFDLGECVIEKFNEVSEKYGSNVKL